MDQVLTLNDGTALGGSYAIENDGKLWVYVHTEIRFAELFALLNDPEKTKKITGNQGGNKTTWRGYKELFCIRKEDGFFSAGLRK